MALRPACTHPRRTCTTGRAGCAPERSRKNPSIKINKTCFICLLAASPEWKRPGKTGWRNPAATKEALPLHGFPAPSHEHRNRNQRKAEFSYRAEIFRKHPLLLPASAPIGNFCFPQKFFRNNCLHLQTIPNGMIGQRHLKDEKNCTRRLVYRRPRPIEYPRFPTHYHREFMRGIGGNERFVLPPFQTCRCLCRSSHGVLGGTQHAVRYPASGFGRYGPNSNRTADRHGPRPFP